jgi:hypothetical protein
MRIRRALLCASAIVAFKILAPAAPFVLFPQAGQLPSPDGHFVVRTRRPYFHGSTSEHRPRAKPKCCNGWVLAKLSRARRMTC